MCSQEGSNDAATVVRNRRTAATMTQSDLAVSAGVSLRTVTRIEGGAIVSMDNLRAVCAALNVDAANLRVTTPEESEEATSPDTEPSEVPNGSKRYLRRIALGSAWLMAMVGAGILFAATGTWIGIYASLPDRVDSPVGTQLEKYATLRAGALLDDAVAEMSKNGSVRLGSVNGHFTSSKVLRWNCDLPTVADLLSLSDGNGCAYSERFASIKKDANGTLDLIAGPMVRSNARFLVLTLPQDSTYDVTMSVSEYADVPSTLEFDPRTIRPEDIPWPEGARSANVFVKVKVRHE